MAKLRCPRCGAIFEGKPNRCPRCNVLFKFEADEKSPEYRMKQPVQEEEPKVEIREVEVIKEVPVEVEKIVIEEKAIIPEKNKENTYFDGKMIQWLGWTLLGCLITVVTLGICFPLAYGWKVKWRTKHTVVNGYRHQFDGKPGSLIGRWILWELLTIVTIGIFGLWIPTKLQKWAIARTVLVFDKEPEEEKPAEEVAEPAQVEQQEEPKQIEEKPAEEAKEEAK